MMHKKSATRRVILQIRGPACFVRTVTVRRCQPYLLVALGFLFANIQPCHAEATVDTAASGPSTGIQPVTVSQDVRGLNPQTQDLALPRSYIHSGLPDHAVQTLEVLIGGARQQGDHAFLSAALNNLGNLRFAQEHCDDALASYQESAALAKQIGQHDLVAKAQMNASRVLIRLGRMEMARELLRSTFPHADALSKSQEKCDLMLGLGSLMLKAEPPGSTGPDVETPYRALSTALELAEDLHADPLRSFAYGYLGALYWQQKRFGDALELTNRAEFLAQEINRPDIAFRWQWQMARILKEQSDLPSAVAAYRRAVLTLQPIRRQVQNASGDLDPHDRIDSLFFELADLLLKSSGRLDADLYAIRDIVEQGKVVELEDYYRDDCVTAWLDKTSGIDRVALKTAALYPILFPDRLELLLTLPEGAERYTVWRNREDITREVRLLRAKLEKRTTREFLPHAQALYEVLIKPLEPALRASGIDTLVFVPDAALRMIPLSALHDGKDFLIRHYAVATSPGLNLTDPRPIPREQAQALLVGMSKATHGFPALPHVEEEISRIAEQFPARILQDRAFQLKNLQKELTKTPFRIVHIASHGQFSEKVENTFVVASDGKISMDTLGKLMGMSRYRDEPVELLTLSACQTAAGDDRAALGLAGIAVKAGARSALASLWFINDPAATVLITEFYKQLKSPAMSKAKALQHAQWLLLDDKRYSHPGYWAPFLMIGNWL